MNKLFPTFDVPSVANDVLEVEYKESIFFDQRKGDIVLDSAGRVKIANGQEAWMQWCMKILASERGTLLAYPSPDIGVEMEHISTLPDREAKEIAIENTIKETLMNDPAHRTIEVKDFAFKHSIDSVVVSFWVVGADGYTGKITIEVEG